MSTGHNSASGAASLEESAGRGWALALYPRAGEGGGAWSNGSPALRVNRDGPAQDPMRSAHEAARRARGKIRRYCAGNRLNRLATLTYAGEGNHDPYVLREHLGLFFRRLRTGLGGDPFPYVWVPEWHKSGHGLHAHFAVGRYVKRSAIEEAWGHGFVHIKLIGDLPVGTGTLGEARRAAGYLSKYIGKGFGDESPPGLHRYEVAQGFEPKAVRVTGRYLGEVLGRAAALMGSDAAYVWQSQVSEGWKGPPAVWASWD